jgi:hypothetical protein
MKSHGRIVACAVAGAAALAGLTVTASGASATSAVTTAPAIASPALSPAAIPAESACPHTSSHPTLYYTDTDTGAAVTYLSHVRASATHAECEVGHAGVRIQH